MGRTEKTIILVSIVYTVLYIPFFFYQTLRFPNPPNFLVILPLHFLGMILNFTALIVTFRDLYLRPFADPNAKLIWCLLILMTGGVGWLVYLFKYAFKPRTIPVS